MKTIKLLPKDAVGNITKALPVTGGVIAGTVAARYVEKNMLPKWFKDATGKTRGFILAVMGIALTALEPPLVKGVGLGMVAKGADIVLDEMDREAAAAPQAQVPGLGNVPETPWAGADTTFGGLRGLNDETVMRNPSRTR